MSGGDPIPAFSHSSAFLSFRFHSESSWDESRSKSRHKTPRLKGSPQHSCSHEKQDRWMSQLRRGVRRFPIGSLTCWLTSTSASTPQNFFTRSPMPQPPPRKRFLEGKKEAPQETRFGSVPLALSSFTQFRRLSLGLLPPLPVSVPSWRWNSSAWRNRCKGGSYCRRWLSGWCPM